MNLKLVDGVFEKISATALGDQRALGTPPPEILKSGVAEVLHKLQISMLGSAADEVRIFCPCSIE